MDEKDFVMQVEFRERMQRVDDENTRQNKRLEKLEAIMDSVQNLAISIQKLTVQIEQMQREIQRQGERVEEIEKEPADNWKAAVKTVVTVLITAAVTYLISKGGV